MLSVPIIDQKEQVILYAYIYTVTLSFRQCMPFGEHFFSKFVSHTVRDVILSITTSWRVPCTVVKTFIQGRSHWRNV